MPDISPDNMMPQHSASGPSGNLLSFRKPSPRVRTEKSMSPGASGTFEALALMSAAVRGEVGDSGGYRDPAIREFAREILDGIDPRSIEAIHKIFYFCRDRISYFDHEPQEQVVQDARRTIEIGSGDCVSQSVLLATLLAAIGFKSRFVVQSPSREDGYTHVYVEVLFEGRWIALDGIADGESGREFGSVGWRQSMPDMGFETSIPLFS